MKSCRIARKNKGPFEVGGNKFKVRPLNMIVFSPAALIQLHSYRHELAENLFLFRVRVLLRENNDTIDGQ